MTIDHQARMNLQKAVVGYMAGNIRTYRFDDENSDCQHSPDSSVRQISRILYTLHDDFIDHPISVTPHHWAALLRVVAFLGTELEIGSKEKGPEWPFRDHDEWKSHQNRLSNFDLPEYDISVHYRIVNPWWKRIPSSIGFLIIGGAIASLVTILVNL